jgi:hypothetical protein
MSGARFNVISSRRSPLHKFVIQKITTPLSGREDQPKRQPTNVRSWPPVTATMAGLGRPREPAASRPPESQFPGREFHFMPSAVLVKYRRSSGEGTIFDFWRNLNPVADPTQALTLVTAAL